MHARHEHAVGLRVVDRSRYRDRDRDSLRRVTNTGEVHGAEVVQLYGSRLGESTRPRLVGFARVELGPEESRVVELPIDRAALLEWDAGRGELVLRPGEYRLEVGRNAEDRFGPISMTCP